MDRYSRQRRFSRIGDSGQERLLAARVTIIGCGALGTHIAQHLARAGVGFLRICDRDFVEFDNLQRQVLFDEEDARQRLPKAVAAANKIAAINRDVRVDARVTDVTAGNVLALIDGADLVLDGTDNFTTRFLINEACTHERVPWVYGGCVSAHGMVLVVLPGETACFACLMPEAPGAGQGDTCDTVGVIGPAVAVVAGIQSAEAFKILVGDLAAVNRSLVTVDLWQHDVRSLSIPRDPNCPVCVGREFPRLQSPRAEGTTTVLCGRNAVQVSPPVPAALDLAEFQRRLGGLGPIRCNEHVICFEQEGLEATLFRDGRALIKGTDEPAVARSFYARYVGM